MGSVNIERRESLSKRLGKKLPNNLSLYSSLVTYQDIILKMWLKKYMPYQLKLIKMFVFIGFLSHFFYNYSFEDCVWLCSRCLAGTRSPASVDTTSNLASRDRCSSLIAHLAAVEAS